MNDQEQVGTLSRREQVKKLINRRSKYLAAAGVLLTVGAFVALNITNTRIQGVSSYRDCADDTIIQCGAISKEELLQKYDQNVGDVQHVYPHYGITRSDLAGTSSDIQSGTVYQDGRVVVNGKTVATNAYSVSRLPFNDANGNTPTKVIINGSTYYDGPNMSIFIRSVDAYVYFRNGEFYKAVLSACGNPLLATPVPAEKPPVVTPPKPVVTPKPTPIYSCDSLALESKISRTSYRFAATATGKNGAEVVNYTYNFGDGTKLTDNNSTGHVYSKPGTYKITVVANININGVTKPISGANCQTIITVAEAPKTPVYSCNILTPELVKSKDRTYSYTLDYTAEGGAALSKVTYNFGDKKSTTVTNDKSVQHQYATPGTYTTTATVYFTVKTENGTTTQSKACSTPITIAKPDMCTVPGKETLPKNSPDCVTPTVVTVSTTPTELPKTGLGAWIGSALGLGAIAGAAYYLRASRKNLKDAALK